MRYWTYIWLTVIVPGWEMPPTAVPGWVDAVCCPLTKKLPSSCNCNGPPSDPAIAIPPDAGSMPNARAVIAVRKLRSMLVSIPVMAISHPGERRFKPLLADACLGRRVSSRDREAYCAGANRQGWAPTARVVGRAGWATARV